MAKPKKVNPFLMWVLGWAGPLYINLVRATTRQTIMGEDRLEEIRSREDGFIIAFWHARILMMVPLRRLYPGERFWFMVSEHRDGDMITRAVKPFDITFARGSSRNPRKLDKKKSGSDALRTLINALRQGDAVGLTPDGPRGPRQRCQPGLVQLARMSGVPVYPVGYASRRAKTFSSWDRFHLPLPFTEGCYVFGDPIEVTRDGEGDLEADRLRIEQALNTVTARADEAMGRLPVSPAETRNHAAGPSGSQAALHE